MKKTFRKAMLSTMAMLLVGVMSLTGVTYAWFTSGTQATVADINVTVEAAEGSIQITTAAPDSTGKFNFTGKADPNSYLTSVYGTTELKAVSAVNPDGTKPQFFSAVINKEDANGRLITSTKQENSVVTNADNTKTAYWYEFDLYFYNPANEGSLNVYLDGRSTFTDTTIGVASRISFTNYAANTYSDTLTAKTYNGAIGSTLILEPNAKEHIDSGNVDYEKITGNTAGEKKYEYNGINVEATDFDRLGSANVERVTTFELGEEKIIATVNAGEVVKVTVCIWVEGQDADCQNELAGTSFVSKMLFTTNVEEIAVPEAPEQQG